jgi:sulfur-carrier protein adenylyltransferase/sulfurtransferase
VGVTCGRVGVSVIEDLTPSEVADRLASSLPPLLLDVRETWERDTATLPGSVHIPLGELPTRVGELPEDAEIVVYCHHGMRSLQAGMWLAQLGFDEVTNLAGGIDAWSREIDDSIPRYA